MLLQRHDDSSQGFDIDGPTHQYAVASAQRDLERRNASACLDYALRRSLGARSSFRRHRYRRSTTRSFFAAKRQTLSPERSCSSRITRASSADQRYQPFAVDGFAIRQSSPRALAEATRRWWRAYELSLGERRRFRARWTMDAGHKQCLSIGCSSQTDAHRR
ncbi:MAG: hypothetical protein RJA70_3863 [Pseudomonadota bacterium]|jgi:hypothetical protein